MPAMHNTQHTTPSHHIQQQQASKQAAANSKAAGRSLLVFSISTYEFHTCSTAHFYSTRLAIIAVDGIAGSGNWQRQNFVCRESIRTLSTAHAHATDTNTRPPNKPNQQKFFSVLLFPSIQLREQKLFIHFNISWLDGFAFSQSCHDALACCWSMYCKV